MSFRRPSSSLFASLAVHIVVVGFFVQALVLQRPLIDIFGRRQADKVGPVERIGFLVLPARPNVPPTPGRAGGNGRPERAALPRLVPPSQVPVQLPTPSQRAGQATEEEPGTGPLVGGGGNLRGIQPRYGDPRLWGGATGPVATAPKTPVQRLDSVITDDIARITDSLRVANGNARAPGDWTIERNGKKYGVDSRFIRLGPVSIPTAVLAMLPLNVTNNPSVSQRERAYSAMHDDISLHAQQAINEADFQKAVRGIRLRKERERREKEQDKQKAATNAAASGDSTTP
jgi:hypothetical protein